MKRNAQYQTAYKLKQKTVKQNTQYQIAHELKQKTVKQTKTTISKQNVNGTQ